MSKKHNCLEGEYYEFAALWHEKQAALCEAVSRSESRISSPFRDKANIAVIHHRGSAAALRMAARNVLAVPEVSSISVSTSKFVQASRNKEILSLRSDGETYESIANRFGISKSTVRLIIKNSERLEDVCTGNPSDPLSLSVRSRNCIANAHNVHPDKVEIVHVLAIAADISSAKRIPNLGRKSMAEIARIAFSHSLESNGGLADGN
jgi:hypothetical protein